MAAPQGPVSRKLLEKEIEYKRKSLKAYKQYIKPKNDGFICVLEAKNLKKEEELKKCYWIQCMAILKNIFLLSRLYLNQDMF